MTLDMKTINSAIKSARRKTSHNNVKLSVEKQSMHKSFWHGIIAGILTISAIALTYQVGVFIYEQSEQERIIQEYKTSERNCLVTALYHEARGEGTKGLEAVASVIYNRKHHEYYPSSYCGIVNQYKQFSYTLLNKPFGEALEASIPAYEGKVYAEILAISERMVNNRFKPSLAPNVLWYAEKRVVNRWTKKKQVVAEIGRHKFYSDKKGKI
jgi:spore germination cell wall hydrolase CwlJ-like protein